jgi:hypothetical protein
MALNAKQQEIKKLHETVGGFDLEEALAKFASKPKGRPPKAASQAPTTNVNTVDSQYREGRFLLEHLENINAPTIRKACVECGQDFLANYKAVALCSDSCRIVRFKRKYGFEWNPERTEAERWGIWYVPPSIVSPTTLKRLEAFARSLLGIEATPEDAALANTAAAPVSLERGESGKDVATDPTGQLLQGEAEQLAVVSTGTTAAEIKANFRAGLITAHELQEQLAALFR